MQINEAELAKDICYLYHLQAEYSGFMPDLDFGTTFKRSYWKDLNGLNGYDDNSREFLRTGCMVFVLLMAFEFIDGSGDSISNIFEECNEAVDAFIPSTEREALVQEVTLEMLRKAIAKEPLLEAEIEKLPLAFKATVSQYFQNQGQSSSC